MPPVIRYISHSLKYLVYLPCYTYMFLCLCVCGRKCQQCNDCYAWNIYSSLCSPFIPPYNTAFKTTHTRSPFILITSQKVTSHSVICYLQSDCYFVPTRRNQCPTMGCWNISNMFPRTLHCSHFYLICGDSSHGRSCPVYYGIEYVVDVSDPCMINKYEHTLCVE